MSVRPVAVLFDLDGTLIDSIPLLLACVRHAFTGYDGPHPTEAEWVAGIGTPLAKQMAQFATSADQVELLTGRYRAYQREHHDAQTTIYPGALDVLKTLHGDGHPLGIVTSKSNAMLERAIDFLDVRAYMQTAIGADSCHLHKPDPFPVTLALQNLGYGPEEALFVGDSPHDVNAGNGAGVATVAALWGPFSRAQLEPANPTYYLERIDQLPSLVQRIQNARPG